MDLAIWARVLEQYPKTYKERCCWSEKVKRDGLRAAYYERLINDARTNSSESVTVVQETGETVRAEDI